LNFNTRTTWRGSFQPPVPFSKCWAFENFTHLGDEILQFILLAIFNFCSKSPISIANSSEVKFT